VHLALPAQHRLRHLSAGIARRVAAFPSGVPGVTAPHDHVERAAEADQHGGQSGESPGGVRQHVERPGVSVMVIDVDDDVQPLAAVRGHGVVERGVQGGDQGLDVRPLAARAQAHPWPVPRRGYVLAEDVHAEVEPRAVE
jgi:hypothetical protein